MTELPVEKKIDPYLTRLTDSVYFSLPDSRRDRPVMAAVTGSRATLVVEAGASPGHASRFLEALQTLKCPPPRYVALTHWHWDHVFGSAALNIPVIGQVETRRRVAQLAALDWSDAALAARLAAGEEIAFVVDHLSQEMTPSERENLNFIVPDIIFDERLEIDLGGITCRLIHVGGDHSPDSTIIHIPSEGVVFLGDCLYSGFCTSGTFYTAEKLFPLLDRLLELKADYYFPAHSEKPLASKEFRRKAAELKAIGEAARSCRGDRLAAMRRLNDQFGAMLDEEQALSLDEFLNPGVHPY